MTQDQLAHAAKISLSTLQRIHGIETDASITKFARLARALGMPLSQLFEGIDED